VLRADPTNLCRSDSQRGTGPAGCRDQPRRAIGLSAMNVRRWRAPPKLHDGNLTRPAFAADDTFLSTRSAVGSARVKVHQWEPMA